MVDQKLHYLGVLPIGPPLVIHTAFVMKKLGRSVPKVRPKSKNDAKMTPEKPSIVKKNSKSSPEFEKGPQT